MVDGQSYWIELLVNLWIYTVKVNVLLLKGGAKIYEINAVWKHIFRVKGGKLAEIVKGTVISFILSDIVGDPIETIASAISCLRLLPLLFHIFYNFRCS